MIGYPELSRQDENINKSKAMGIAFQCLMLWCPGLLKSWHTTVFFYSAGHWISRWSVNGFLYFFQFLLLGDVCGRWLQEVFGRWLREIFLFLFFLIFLLLGNGYGRWLREMVTGSLCFPFFLDISPCGRWLREVRLREVFGRWLREMVTGSLPFPFFLDISPFGKWLREMVTGSLCFPFFLDISPFGGWLREVFVFLFFLIFLVLVKIHFHWFVGPASIQSSVKPLKLRRCNATNVSSM